MISAIYANRASRMDQDDNNNDDNNDGVNHNDDNDDHNDKLKMKIHGVRNTRERLFNCNQCSWLCNMCKPGIQLF